MSRRIVIVGGGLAGIAAAIRLAEHDYIPIVLETRRKLGGRATSFVDPRNNAILDNCQHVLLGCCTNLIDFYNRIDVLSLIEWHRELYWTAGDGEIFSVSPRLCPAPFHFAFSFARLRLLSPSDRKCIRKCMLRIIRMGQKGRRAWSGRTFTSFLETHGQSTTSIRRFWEPIIVSACNVSCDRVDAKYALHVFQDGFLATRWGAAMGLPTVPLAELYDPVVPIISQLGGEVRTGTSVRAVTYDGNRVTGVVTNDGIVEADAVIAAVPPDRLERLVSKTLVEADARLQSLSDFLFSPIIGVHLWFETEVMSLPHLTVVDRDVQWLFHKGVNEAGHQHLHAVISGADSWMSLSEQEIIEKVTSDIHHVLPRARGLQPIAMRAVKEKRATFAATPEISAIRPPASSSAVGLNAGSVRNLLLAGDWCDTGWPATMEGAVRSGYAAAGAVLKKDLLAADAPPLRISALLGLR